MALLRKFIFTLALLAALPGHAESPHSPAVTMTHLTAVKRMLNATYAAEAVLIGARKALGALREREPERANQLAAFLDRLHLSEIEDRLAPIYARHMSQADAEEIARFFETDLGFKAAQLMLADLRRSDRFAAPESTLTPTERNALERFMRGRAGQVLRGAHEQAAHEARTALAEWARDAMVGDARQTARQLAEGLESNFSSNATDSSTGGHGAARPTFLNQLFLIAGTFARRAAALNKQYEADVAQIGLETMLDPSRLVAGAGIEESRQKVQRFEALLDQYLKACSDMNDNYHREVSAIQETAPNRDAIVAQFEQGIARTYDFNIRLGENQRTLIDLFRRVLTLAESRLGRIALRDGKLVFADDADLATYRALVEQIVAETKREDELNKEQAARRQRAVEALRKL